MSIVVACVGVLTFLTVGFNNCGKKANFSNPYDESTAASVDAGLNLLVLLDEAKKIEGDLIETAESTLADAGDKAVAQAQAAELRKFINSIELLISVDGENLSVDHRRVLDERDYLVNAMAKGRELRIVFDFQREIARLDQADQALRNDLTALDSRLTGSIDSLEVRLKEQIETVTAEIQSQLNAMKDEYRSSIDAFKTQVNVRFDAMNARIDGLEDRVDQIDASINSLNVMLQQLKAEVGELRTTTEAAIASVISSLNALKTSTELQIAQLKDANNQLNQKLVDQQKAFDAYIKAQTTLTSIQSRMCKLDVSTGQVAAGETVCADQDAVEAGGCCLTANAVNCSLMFPEDTAVAEEARNQCSNVLVTVKNHEAMVKEIAETEAEQNALIDQLVADVKNLNDRVAVIEEGMEDLKSIVSDLSNKMTQSDARLLLLEFKASRNEAVATLNERSDLYLAWIARRQMDVRHRFCNANAEVAFNKSDYESARHNWAYCAQRLSLLTKAQELVQLAKAYAEGALSTNVDVSCNYKISGKSVEDMTIAELLDGTVSEKVLKNCSGGPALVLTYLGNIIKLQNKIGPDFRTASYMGTKAKIGQLIYFGTTVSAAGSTALRAFENVDPTSPELKDTYYGIIERVFKNRYVETRLRTVDGKFPTDPSKFSGSVANFNQVYSEAEIIGAGTPYLARLKTQEIESSCGGQCGFKVVARNDVRPVGARFSFPKDSSIKCPIVDETVIIKGKDDKHYAYSLSYTRYKGATEELLPRLVYHNNNHRPIAESTAKAEIGEFLGCGYRVRHVVDRFGIPDALLRGRHILRTSKPYAKSHGLPQCQRFVFNCRLWAGVDNKGEWVAPNPNANILHYLSGLSTTRIENECKKSGASYVARQRDMLPEETDKIHVYKSNASADTPTINLRKSISSSTTQLTKDYWMLQDAEIAYGAGNENVTKATPFFAGEASMGNHFLRGLASMSQYAPVKVQQCFDPN